MRLELVLPLLLTPGLFVLARRLRRQRGTLILAILLLAPALLPASGYLHLWDSIPWFCEFRSRAIADFLPALAGFSFGRFLPPQLDRLTWRDLVSSAFCLVAFLPAFKLTSMRRPPAQFEDKWNGGVALQSTPSTCGPASCASILRQLGQKASERQIASEAGTTLTGTEIWHLARVLRRHGLEAEFKAVYRLGDAPCLVGIRLGAGVGHFNGILADDGELLILAEPLSGERRLRGPTREKYLTGVAGPVMTLRLKKP